MVEHPRRKPSVHGGADEGPPSRARQIGSSVPREKEARGHQGGEENENPGYVREKLANRMEVEQTDCEKPLQNYRGASRRPALPL